MIRLLILFFLLTLASGCAGNTAQRTYSIAKPGDAIAVVGGELISAEELDREVQGALKNVDQEIYDIKRAKLEQIVGRKLWELEAKERGVKVEALQTAQRVKGQEHHHHPYQHLHQQ